MMPLYMLLCEPKIRNKYFVSFEKTMITRTLIASTVNSRYLEFQGTLWNTSGYPYFDISDLQHWEKINSINYI